MQLLLAWLALTERRHSTPSYRCKKALGLVSDDRLWTPKSNIILEAFQLLLVVYRNFSTSALPSPYLTCVPPSPSLSPLALVDRKTTCA
ncbi:hypothetical protein CCMA1212_009947 [Trichoderma ghanense]|uniref:Secreted protein n=1 Tax=Trichoderma ghanense TaxID=65468 RepID=A0ABY2GRD2_9HYPO